MTFAWHEPWTVDAAGILKTASGDPVMAPIGEQPPDVQHAFAERVKAAINVAAGLHTKLIEGEEPGKAGEWQSAFAALPPEAHAYQGGPVAWLANVEAELKRLRGNAAAWTRLYRELAPPPGAGSGEQDAIAEIRRLKEFEREALEHVSALAARAQAITDPQTVTTGVTP